MQKRPYGMSLYSSREQYRLHRARSRLRGGSWGQTVWCAPTKHSTRHPLRIGTHQAMVGDPCVTARPRESVQPTKISSTTPQPERDIHKNGRGYYTEALRSAIAHLYAELNCP